MPYNVLTETGATVIAASTLGAPLNNIGETLLTFRNELIAMVGNRTDVTPDRVDRWTNYGYVDLASSLDLDDLKGSLGFNLVVDSYRYLLPAEVMATRGKNALSVIDTVTYSDLGGLPLRKVDLDAYRMRSELKEEPKEFFRERNLLVVWPTPKAIRAMALDFWIRPTKMTLDNHSPILPYEWHEAILLNARKKAFTALLEFDKALAAENDLVSLVRRKQDRDELEDSGRIVLSSVPRHRGQLQRRRSSEIHDSPRNLDIG